MSNAPSSPAGGKRIEPKVPPMEPILAALLSVIVLGLGQIILGQAGKGIALLAGSVLVSTVLLIGGLLIFFPCCLLPFVPIIPAVDAFLIAKKLKEGQSVGEWDFF